MNIAILGYGKMGKKVSMLAERRGHTITAISCSKNQIKDIDLSSTDIAIEFSTPDAAFNNISYVLKHKIPVVSGTTGWLDKLSKIESLCLKMSTAFLHSSNFSLGMNIFFELNEKLAKLMKGMKYKQTLHDLHHKKKLDAPSGTAINLKDTIDRILESHTPITFTREGNNPGKHTVNYTSSVDKIEISHTAKNRDGFAIGAIIAAEWIVKRKGVFTMKDILKNKLFIERN